MPAMRQKLLTFAAAMSAVLFAVVCVLWVMSYVHPRGWGDPDTGLGYGFGSAYGGATVYHRTGTVAAEFRWLGFVFFSARTSVPVRAYRIPYWAFAVPLAAIAVAGRMAPQAAPRPGHCPACGYDLTGNESGACPECGAVPKADPKPPSALISN